MKKKSSKTYQKPEFKNEAEEADWYHTAAGKHHSARQLQQAVSKGIITSEAQTPQEVRAALDQAEKEGRAVRFKRGMHIKPTDPAMLQELVNWVKAKQTQSVSLRIPLADLEAAKKIAEKTGMGYQTVLKEMIHEGLQRAS